MFTIKAKKKNVYVSMREKLHSGALFFLSFLLIFSFLSASDPLRTSASPAAIVRNLTLDANTTFQTMEGFGFFGARGVWWSAQPFAPGRALPLYAGGEPMTDAEWIDFILLDLGITMWRNEIYPFLPVHSLESTNPQDSNWPEQNRFVKALHDRAVELGIDLRVILTVWSPPGEWKYNQHTRAFGPWQSPSEPPEGMGMNDWNRLMPEHYMDFAYWLVAALQLYRDIGVEVYAISPQNEPYFNQPFNSSFYNADSFVEMLNIVAPIIYSYFPDVYIFGAEAMLGHEHSGVIQSWTNPNMQFHRRILENASPEAMRNFVFAHHGYYDGVYAQALENHPALWAAERNLLATHGVHSNPRHRLWMTETSGYSNYWLDEGTQRPGSLALGMAIQTALIYGDVSAWVWWQGSDITDAPYGGYYELMRPGINRNKIAVSQHFYRYIRPGAVRIGTDLDIPSRYLMTSAFVHEELDNMVLVFINNGGSYYKISLYGAAEGMAFQSVVTTGSPHYLMPGPVIVAGQNTVHIPPYSITTLVNGSYTEHGSRENPRYSSAEMEERDVYLAIRALTHGMNQPEVYNTVARNALNAEFIIRDLAERFAFFTRWSQEHVEIEPPVDATPYTAGEYGTLHFRIHVSQGDAAEVTESFTLRLVYGMDYNAPPPVEEEVEEEIPAEIEPPEKIFSEAAPTEAEESDENGMNPAIIIAIILGAVLIAITVFMFRKNKKPGGLSWKKRQSM